MSDKREKMLDDVARMAGGTVGILSSIGQQIRSDLKARAEDTARGLDLVSREEFERVELLLEQALEKQSALEARLSALENPNKK